MLLIWKKEGTGWERKFDYEIIRYLLLKVPVLGMGCQAGGIPKLMEGQMTS